jgi:hypothetical protein
VQAMKSTLRYSLLLIAMTLASFPATAATSGYDGRCDIIFEVQTTTTNFTGTAVCKPFTITAVDDMMNIPVIAVEVATMATGNSRRDKAMREMFEHTTFPLISGHTKIFLPGEHMTSGGQLIQPPEDLTFALTIRDITHRITATVTKPQVDASATEATLRFDLSLSSFELNPPSFLGIIRVNDTVSVKVNMVLDINRPTSTQE